MDLLQPPNQTSRRDGGNHRQLNGGTAHQLSPKKRSGQKFGRKYAAVRCQLMNK
jgi:hypothetical protein